MYNLGNLIGNWSRYFFRDSYSNLKDYKEWDNSIVYQKFRSARDTLVSVKMSWRLLVCIRILMFSYFGIGILGFLWAYFSLKMFLSLLCGILVLIPTLVLGEYPFYYFLRAKKLAGEILWFKHRDRWGETKSFPGDRFDKDQGKRIMFYKSMLSIYNLSRRVRLLTTSLYVIFSLACWFIDPSLTLFWLSVLLMIHLNSHLTHYWFENTRETMILEKYNWITTASRLSGMLNEDSDDWFRSYLSFSRYLLSFRGSQYGGLTEWIYKRIYDWHFQPSRLERLLGKDREYRDYYDKLKLWIKEEYSASEDIEDAVIVESNDSGNTREYDSTNGMTWKGLKLSLDEEWPNGNDVVERLAGKDDALRGIAKDPLKMEVLILILCSNWSLFGRTWLSLFKKNESVRDEYLGNPRFDPNEIFLIQSVHRPNEVPVIHSDLPLHVILSLLYHDTLTDLGSIRTQTMNQNDRSNIMNWNGYTVMDILDFKNRNEFDRFVNSISWKEWDRLAMEKVIEDGNHLDKEEISRIYLGWRALNDLSWRTPWHLNDEKDTRNDR